MLNFVTTYNNVTTTHTTRNIILIITDLLTPQTC